MVGDGPPLVPQACSLSGTEGMGWLLGTPVNPCVAHKLLLWQAPKKNALIEGIKMVTNTFWQKTDKTSKIT